VSNGHGQSQQAVEPNDCGFDHDLAIYVCSVACSLSAASTGSSATAPSPPGTTKLAVRYEATIHIAAINEWL
jgi:hypothetical protein